MSSVRPEPAPASGGPPSRGRDFASLSHLQCHGPVVSANRVTRTGLIPSPRAACPTGVIPRHEGSRQALTPLRGSTRFLTGALSDIQGAMRSNCNETDPRPPTSDLRLPTPYAAP